MMSDFVGEKGMLGNQPMFTVTVPAPSSNETVSDRVDSDIESHVTTFLSSVATTLTLSKMSLDTPEDAKRSLSMIRQLQDRVKSHRRAARALKQILAADNPGITFESTATSGQFH
jgi:hypothetical protein